MGCVSIHTLVAKGSRGCTRSGKDKEKNSLSLQLHLAHGGETLSITVLQDIK